MWQAWSSGREEWEEWDPTIIAEPHDVSDFKFVHIKRHAGKSYCIYRDRLGRWFRLQVNIQPPVFPGQE